MTDRSMSRYRTRLATTASDVEAAQGLRHLAFHGHDGRDADAYDAACVHVLIEDRRDDRLVCCFRILPLTDGREIATSYSAQYYELSALASYEGRMVEMGRFCIRPGLSDPDILRAAWGALTAYVDDNDVKLLFGCASFQGTEAREYLDAFAVLRERHLAPKRWLPQVKAPDVIRFAARLRRKPCMKTAMRRMPPLLKTYLLMGGWVSDHAVVDPQMNTLHVFTGVEVGLIPPARKRLLRALS